MRNIGRENTPEGKKDSGRRARGSRKKIFPAVLVFLLGGGFAGGAEGANRNAAVPADPPAAPAGQKAADRPLRKKDYPKTDGFVPLPVSAGVSPPQNIGGVDQELTRRYIAQYSSPGGIAWLNGIIRQGSPYIPFIREEIARRGLPPELLYLPVIESGYKPQAVSKSGAAGLWQFMKNSMAPFGMRVTDLVDERMDFWKSTQGALSKLEENYRHFGDWALALAAYNAGLGGVNRVVQRTGIRDYWTLCEKKELRAETIHYVPKFLAAAHIISNPRRYGVDFWPEAPDWTRIPLGRTADIEVLAELAGLDREILETANPELRRRISPPDAAYQLKVPAEAAPALLALLEQGDLKLIKHYSHTIRSGDTLSALAQHYGVSAELIRENNPGLQPRSLRIGDIISIPAIREVVPYKRDPAPGRSFTGTHLVKRGETLWAIALAYGVDPEELAAANGMELNEILPEGKTLKTPIK
ncbi:MAG: transglycosylase SLT domain-containing protein [Treponema sp.]|nr:transglycosylase SLT domain-containing protein [Treponema sp.]